MKEPGLEDLLCFVGWLWGRKTAGKISPGWTGSWSGLSGLAPGLAAVEGQILPEQDYAWGAALDRGAALRAGSVLVKMGLCSSALASSLKPAGDWEPLLFLGV